jgi:hypothetical protein
MLVILKWESADGAEKTRASKKEHAQQTCAPLQSPNLNGTFVPPIIPAAGWFVNPF